MSRAVLSQNTRIITVHTTIKAVTKILCVEILRIESAIQKKKKKRSIWVRNWLQRKGATHTIFKELYDEDPREYKAVMRVTPAQVEILLNLIAPKIQRDDTLMRDAIPARVKLEITLVYLSSGISYRLLSVFFRVSKASIIKIIPEVCAAINESLKDFIKARSYSPMPGAPGSGAGKGGGAGGSVRESGGGLGQFGAAQEEGYFYKKTRDQLEKMKQQAKKEPADDKPPKQD